MHKGQLLVLEELVLECPLATSEYYSVMAGLARGAPKLKRLSMGLERPLVASRFSRAADLSEEFSIPPLADFQKLEELWIPMATMSRQETVRASITLQVGTLLTFVCR